MNLRQALTGPNPLMMSCRAFMELDLPEREFLLVGDFPLEKASITLVSGDAGIGKTMFLLTIGKMIAGGRAGLGWTCQAPDSSKVLFVDGEMGLADLKERIKAFDLDDYPHFTLLSKVLLDRHDVAPELNLNDVEVRKTLTKTIIENGFGVVILDNLFSLFQNHDFNSFSAWAPVNHWLLHLRSHDIAVILAHHTSKSGSQLGTASRLFNINTALKLNGETLSDGDDCCCFSVEVEKQRSQGIKLMDKLFILRRQGGEYINDDWTIEEESAKSTSKDDGENRTLTTVAALLVAGETQDSIGKVIKQSQPTVSRLQRKLLDRQIIHEVDGKFEFTETGNEFLSKFPIYQGDKIIYALDCKASE